MSRQNNPQTNLVEFLAALIQKPSVTPEECGIYALVADFLGDFRAIYLEENGVKNAFLYKDFGGVGEGDFGGNFGESGGGGGESCGESTGESFCDPRGESSLKTPLHFCFAGHIDVVPSGEGWDFPPFEGVVNEGKIYGRGAVDMKGGVAAFLFALRRFGKRFEAGGKAGRGKNGENGENCGVRARLSVLLTSDEEGDAIYGTRAMLSHLRNLGLLPDFAIVAEPTCAGVLGDTIKIGRRGSINGVLRILGTQGHAAYPQKCTNPIDLAAKILPKMAGASLDSGTEHFAPSRLVITDIRAGLERTNVVPAELRMMFNVRNSPLTSVESLRDFLGEILAATPHNLELKESAKPFITHSARLTDSLKAAISEVCGLEAALDTSGGTSDARFFAEFGVEVAEFGLLNATIHAANENTAVCDVEALAAIFERFLEKFLG